MKKHVLHWTTGRCRAKISHFKEFLYFPCWYFQICLSNLGGRFKRRRWVNVCMRSQPRPPEELIPWSLSYQPATICPPPPPLTLSVLFIFLVCAHARTHSYTHTQSLHHLWLTRDSRCLCQPWNVAASLCVKDLPGFPHNDQSDASSQSHQILFICSLLFVSLFLAHPRLCLCSASVFFSVSPELHRKHKEGGRKLILWYCWVGLVLSYDSEHRGRGITRQIGYMPVISSYKNWWCVAAFAAKIITVSSDSFCTFQQQTAQAGTENKRKHSYI